VAVISPTLSSVRTAWPGWNRLPRDTRDTFFLLAVIAWTVLPHVPHLPLWSVLLSAGVLAWRAWLALRSAPLPGRATVITVLVGALVLTWWSHRTLLGKDAGVTLLVTLVALKTLELRARRDAFVIFFLGFFLVLTHFLYSQAMLTAATMLVSVWGLLTALVLAHMPVGQPSLGLAARLAARFALLGAPIMALLFVLFPRVSPLWGVPNDAASRTGLSSSMQMGQIAELAIDDSVAMRLRFVSGSPPPAHELYFRGPVLTAFDGETWRVSSLTPPGEGANPRLSARVQGAPVDYELTIEPLRINSLPVLDYTPELPRIEGQRVRQREDGQWASDRPVFERQRIVARAYTHFTLGPVAPDARPTDALELPPGRNPRMLVWATQLRADPRYANADARTLAQLLLRHIATQGYSYTLTPGTYGRDGIDEFWFDGKRGFCEHFASAFVVAMRALNVPARVVTGYQGAELNPVDGSYVVRQSFAHAWAEYWASGVGWVRVDPTAAVAPDRIDRSRPLARPQGFVASALDTMSPDLWRGLRNLLDAADNAWNQRVLNYSRGTQLDLLRWLGFDAPGLEDLVTLLGVCVIAFALGGAAWAAWERRRMPPWLRAWEGIRHGAHARGLRTAAHWTPRTLARHLQDSVGTEASAAVQALLEFEALRYARTAAPMRRSDLRRLASRCRRELDALPARAFHAGSREPLTA